MRYATTGGEDTSSVMIVANEPTSGATRHAETLCVCARAAPIDNAIVTAVTAVTVVTVRIRRKSTLPSISLSRSANFVVPRISCMNVSCDKGGVNEPGRHCAARNLHHGRVGFNRGREIVSNLRREEMGLLLALLIFAYANRA